MFRRILVANRGEIAVRIIRCCRELGIESVAVYSTADKDALHVQLATKAVCIGPAKSSDSYLNTKNILAAALQTNCDAIHPGFGFLSENAHFARLCEECGLIFIGPDYKTIEMMGDKSKAVALMRANNVPVVPGSNGAIEDVHEAQKLAQKIGYPVLIKAAMGGGGRGMRRVYEDKDFAQAFMAAKMEAEACFGDGTVYLEKLIINPKHIEFQILADKFGHTIHLGERDCSVQRRNQKLIEESPCKILSPELREKMGADAIKAAKAAGYYSAGTIEFVVDRDNNYYFIEMNTRIQVEHTVTEMLSGIDLIRQQILIACGLPLNIKQEDVQLKGWAIECRINAENPKEDFRPSPGKINFLHFPAGNGVRVDSALYNGYKIPPFYDSMLAKIIVHAPTRLDAIRKMRRALEELVISGVETTANLNYLIMHHKDFVRGIYDTGFLDKNLEKILSWENRY